MLLSTGTRTALILLAAPLAIVFGSQASAHAALGSPARRQRRSLAVPRLPRRRRPSSAPRTPTARRWPRARTCCSPRATEHGPELHRPAGTDGRGLGGVPLVTDRGDRDPGKPIVFETLFEGEQATPRSTHRYRLLAKFGLHGPPRVASPSSSSATSGRCEHSVRGPEFRRSPQLALIGFGAVVVAWSAAPEPLRGQGLRDRPHAAARGGGARGQ